jgi:hypothetical protein
MKVTSGQQNPSSWVAHSPLHGDSKHIAKMPHAGHPYSPCKLATGPQERLN